MVTNMWGKVIKLVTPAPSKSSHSEFLETVKQNLKPNDRLLVIISDADENSFDIGIASHGLTNRDKLALLEVAKLDIYTKLMTKEKEQK